MEGSSNDEYSLSSILPIASGFYTDCRNLLDKFAALKSHTFSDFAAQWKEHCFSLVYCGRTNGLELATFCSEVFKTVKRFLGPHESLVIRLGAMYLLYALYFKQPTNGFNKIRLTVSDIKDIKCLLDDFTKKEYGEGRYVFYKLLVSNAFHFCATKTEYYYKINRGPKLDTAEISEGDRPDVEDDLDNPGQSSSALLSIFDESTAEQLTLLHNKYQELKSGLSRSGTLEPSLDVLENNFPNLLHEKLTNLRKKLEEMSALSVQHVKRKSTAHSALVPPKGKKRGRKRLQRSESEEDESGENAASNSEDV